MLRNYLTVAIRSLVSEPAYALINLVGLSVGLAACVLMLLYVRYETSYDTWLPDSDRIYQVQSTVDRPGQPALKSQNSPFPLRALMPARFPQIEALSVLSSGKTVTMRNGEPLFIDVATVDPAFFDIFRLEFAHGTAAGALPDANSIVLTESEALKEFGSTDVVGRTMSLGAGPGKRDYRVTGVLRDLPGNSSLRLGLLFRFDPAQMDGLPPEFTGWSAMRQQHYVKLHRPTDATAIEAALPAWLARVAGGDNAPAGSLDLKLTPIASVHIGEAQDGALAPGGDPRSLATFAIVALLTLGMAVLNFVNLSTARATKRAREVSLRKVLGATRPQLVVQMLGEALLLAGAAMLLALTIVEMALPWVGARVGANLQFSYFGDGGLLLPALGLFAVTGLLGGLYPAAYLSGFKPAAVLRANQSQAQAPGTGRLRAALIVVQFAVATGLIICTWVVYSQTRHVETVDPGYRRDGLIQIDAAWRFAGDSSEYAAAYREMMAVPGVVAAGRTNLGLAAINQNNLKVRAPGAESDLSIGFYGVDPGFLRTLDMRLLAGRFLDERFANDRLVRADEYAAEAAAAAHARLVARGLNVVANRNAASLLGFRSPQSAVGKTIAVEIDGAAPVPATIVGVVEDARMRTARDPIEPLIYGYDPDSTSQVIVRYAAARPGEVMAGLNRVWRKFEPEIPFQARFAETIIADLYARDRGRGALFAAFSALAVLIACLGLYSLASFSAVRRTKEIGIRKVFGATVRDIVALLTWQFTKPVVIANLIAWPVAWWVMRDWLNQFDTRIALGPTPFVFAALLALAIAVGTIAGHALRVARANPINALRYE